MIEIYNDITSVYGYFKFLALVGLWVIVWSVMCRSAARAYFDCVVLPIMKAQRVEPEETPEKEQLNG